MITLVRPDLINKKTKLIRLSELNYKFVSLQDDLIIESKRLNNSILSGYWIEIENELYYLKIPSFTQGFLNELIGEKISLYFDIPTVNYKLCSVNLVNNNKEIEVYGLLSKWARKKDYTYQTLLDIVYEDKPLIDPKQFDYTDLSILEQFDQVYGNQPLCKELRLMITRDFITQETDRLESEILVAKKDNKVELGYLTDYEYEFGENNNYIYHIFKYLTLNPNDKETIKQIQNDLYFQESFTRAMDLDIEKIINQIQEETNINIINYDKELFKTRTESIKKVIKKNRFIK